ncbi:M3 family oligoendopeptidase [bacterium]|nr:M3 family oligoendopeptidase [bacterium]
MNWDLTPYFPEFNGFEMTEFKAKLKSDAASLLQSASILPTLDASNSDDWESVFLAYEDLRTRFYHLGSYLNCLTSADATDEDYKKEEAAYVRSSSTLTKVGVEMQHGLKNASDDDFAAFLDRESLSSAEYYIDHLRKDARFTMSSECESLAADLSVDGLDAWGRLYDTVSGKLEFEMKWPDGRAETIPIAQRRALMEGPDRAVRQSAFEGGNAAWKSVEDVTAAALNAISGTRHTLYDYRSVSHFLDRALFDSAISQKTLDAMFEAIKSEIEIPRDILRLKADAMGLGGVAWYDLGAPLPFKEHPELSWDTAREMVKGAFDKAYPKLGEFQQMMYDKRWIEWEPRPGKRPGGFCTGSRIIKESRIYMTYKDSIGDVRTLAHEAGHAFHSYVMRDLRPYQSGYPMTLAESASTFAEMILSEGMLQNPNTTEIQKALTLDTEVGHGAIFLMDIPVRFEFERAVYEERKSGELSVTQFKDLMVQTQRDVFGDVLLEGGEDPYFWASKLHFYITGVSFYNFPYTFGFLLSRGLFANFKEQGPDFLPRYEDFLLLTGSDTAEGVAKRSIGEDLEKPDFWVRAIHTLDEPLAQLRELLPNTLATEDTSFES